MHMFMYACMYVCIYILLVRGIAWSVTCSLSMYWEADYWNATGWSLYIFLPFIYVYF